MNASDLAGSRAAQALAGLQRLDPARFAATVRPRRLEELALEKEANGLMN